MPADNRDTYPQGYLEARRKFSNEFLDAFDGLVDHYGRLEYAPSATIEGMIYSIFLLIFPRLAVWSIMFWNFGSHYVRKELYEDLIQAAKSPERIDLISQRLSLQALEDKAVKMTDLANCPIHALKVILQPSVIQQLKQNNEQVADQIRQANEELKELERQLRGDRQSHNSSASWSHQYDTGNQALNRQIERKKEERAGMKTIMEQIRESGYKNSVIGRLIPQFKGFLDQGSSSSRRHDDDYRDRHHRKCELL